ncbi:acetamidase/formamidase family protein [Sandarakinorhabdus sp.]|uniref:acetamidase/formamidase family protein n=1 Tax=Sandarakinorhabdus sp. TaxID=1916663 RepID=UPI00286DE345|nr:acetamidase/formamidase family protein [Sandarakinorhabdus sp.]
MRTIILVLALAMPSLATARQAATAAMTGQWIVTLDRWGNPEYSVLNLRENDRTLSGDWDGDPVKGTVGERAIMVSTTDGQGGVYEFRAKRAADTLSGVADFPDNNNPSQRLQYRFTARRVPARASNAAQVHDFLPADYANSFSAERPPVLTIWPGDTVRTSTIDSGGVDAKGQTRALFGNPQTGPFFVAGAAQGDTLVVHIRKLRLNRDWADSLDSIVGRALGSRLVADGTDLGKPVRWRLDRSTGMASPELAAGRLKDYKVPVRPMLGGLGLASGFGAPAMSTGDTGRAGGNMDFPEVIEGNTVYLPVQQPGALLYLGDGHALQGDGETSQYGLETSLDVEFTVDLIKSQTVPMPRVESPTELMVLGQAGSLDEALKAASTGLISWLRQDYGLTLSETAQVMGTAVRFSVPNLAGRSVGVAARIDKALLPQPLKALGN